MIVRPDGEFSSWYFVSPVDSTFRYGTYIAKEVPQYIEANYPVIKDRRARAITGLSMGGHGGLFPSFRHADFFVSCGIHRMPTIRCGTCLPQIERLLVMTG